MGAPKDETSTDPVAAGWGHLADAEWLRARDSFSEALARHETAGSLEGLSWAAWWLDDAATVFDARERAYRAYLADDDTVGAARMAVWLAGDNLDFRGATAVAGGWLRRARRLLAPLAAGPEHGWLAFHEGYLATLSGDDATAGQLAAAAADVGRRCGVPDLEMLGLALEGSLLVGSAEIDEGMQRLDEATAMAGEALNPISGGWACCFLVSACTAVLDLERAAEWCERIADFAERYGSRYIRAICRAEYGTVYLWRGRWSDAEQLLESSVEDFTRSRPAFVPMPLIALAELRRRQGRPEEVSRLLERAGVSGQALLCQARVEFDRGNVRRSADLVERMLRQGPPERRVDRGPALEHLIRSRVASGELDEARVVLTDLHDLAEVVGTEPVTALALLAEGLLMAATGDHEGARTLLEDAVDRFTRCRAPFEAGRARIELATSLAAVGRVDQAAQEASSALNTLERLGADAETKRARRVAELIAEAPDTPVTRRERDVLGLLAEGLTNREIAARLVVSEHTVHRHVTNILRKLDLPSRTAAAAYAVRSGWFVDHQR